MDSGIVLEVLSADVRLKDSGSHRQKNRHSFCRLDDGAHFTTGDRFDQLTAKRLLVRVVASQSEEEWPNGSNPKGQHERNIPRFGAHHIDRPHQTLTR